MLSCTSCSADEEVFLNVVFESKHHASDLETTTTAKTAADGGEKQRPAGSRHHQQIHGVGSASFERLVPITSARSFNKTVTLKGILHAAGGGGGISMIKPWRVSKRSCDEY